MYQGIGYDLAAVVPEVLASGIADSLCTLQRPTGVLTEDGTPDNTFEDVPGYVGIQCMNAPTSIARITAGERKSQAMIESDNSNHVWLAGYYPAIAANTDWRAVVDGVIYDILGSETDSQFQTTRLSLQLARV